MNWWIIYQLGKMREQELLKEAERVRLLRKCRTKGRKPISSYCALLNKMGELLVCRGIHLQRHCEEK